MNTAKFGTVLTYRRFSIAAVVVAVAMALSQNCVWLEPVEVADIIIDDTDDGFRCEGGWYPATTSDEYNDGTMWTYGDSVASATAVFTPQIEVKGTYEVWEWHGDDPNWDHANDAPYTINYARGSETVHVDLQENIGQWNLLGSYKFDAGTGGNITITNKANGNVVADAVKLVYVGR